MRTKISLAIMNAIASANLTQTQFAEKAGTTQSTINSIISTDLRISPETLRKITHAIGGNHNASILIAHLEDEITRSGHKTTDFDIRHNPREFNQKITETMNYISARINYDQDLAQLLIDLVAMLENGRISDVSAAAETHEKYSNN